MDGFTLPPYWIRVSSATYEGYFDRRKPRTKACISWAWAGLAVRPVPIAHPRHYSVKTTPGFSELKAELTEQVRVEVRAAQQDMPA